MLGKIAALSVSLVAMCLGQEHKVPPEYMYHRVYAVVPLVGAGTKADPKRPMFAPPPVANAGKGPDRNGIIGYQMQLSDDKQFALVEFVAANRDALKPILQYQGPGVAAFERGIARKQDIEAAFQQHKAGFTLDSFRPMRLQ